MKNKLETIVKGKLCNGCGTCFGVCPARAISLKYSSFNRTYVPIIDKLLCTGCGICYRVCPGMFMTLRKRGNVSEYSGKDLESEFGQYTKCFVGYSCDEHIRLMSSSGGIATSLALFLLDKKKMDAIITTKMIDSLPLHSEPVMASSRFEVLNAMGSKYCPAATNSILRNIDSDLIQSCCFLGLPCHIQGINNALGVRPLRKIKEIVTIGLLCGGTKGREATEWVLRKRKIPISSVESIKYRGGGWPGGMCIVSKDKQEIHIPYSEYYDEYFESWQPWRCFLCLDRTSESADISLGDAWLPELLGDSAGISIIIARTSKGLMLLKEAAAANYIRIFETLPVTIVASQKGLWRDLQNIVSPALYMASVCRRMTPTYGDAYCFPGIIKMLKWVKYFVRLSVYRKMSSCEAFKGLVTNIRRIIGKAQ